MTTFRSKRALAAIGAISLVLTIGIGAVAAAGPHGGGRATTTGIGSGVRAGGPYAGTAPVGTVPLGTLTADQSAALAQMADEEKLAQDLYAALAARYPSVVFGNIGAAESTHLAAVRAMLARYGVADPTAGLAAGTFALPGTTTLYASLLAQGSASEAAAFTVGRTVELGDIAKLDAARTGVTAVDVLRVYGNLRNGSAQHLGAFSRLLGI